MQLWHYNPPSLGDIEHWQKFHTCTSTWDIGQAASCLAENNYGGALLAPHLVTCLWKITAFSKPFKMGT